LASNSYAFKELIDSDLDSAGATGVTKYGTFTTHTGNTTTAHGGIPGTEAGATHNFLTGYTQGTQTFSKAQPVQADISDMESTDIVQFGGLIIAGMKLQQFTLLIYNNGGTLQHAIGGINYSVANALLDKITGASVTLQNTPTGADASTAFAYGGKISTVSTGTFIFDTAVQSRTSLMGTCTTAYNDTGTAFYAGLDAVSHDVNGTTRVRMELVFYKTDGTNFALNTTNIPSGKNIQIQCLAYLN